MERDAWESTSEPGAAAVIILSEGTADRATAAIQRSLSKLENEIAIGACKNFQTLSIADAFTSRAVARRTIEAVCRAPVVIFDCEGFEPGVILLIGVRGTVRRGVSVCVAPLSRSAGPVFIPYNLQGVSFVDLSADSSSDTAKRLARKVWRSQREYETDPVYSDLPSYCSAGRPSDVPSETHDEVLFLCPYAEPYAEVCWKATLKPILTKNLRLRRLFDDTSARLAANTFHTRLRHHADCIVDWTNLRPDLFYELGVRIAVRGQACLHVIAEGRNWLPSTSVPAVETSFGRWPCPTDHVEMVARNATLRHLHDLLALFRPVSYEIQGNSRALEAALCHWQNRRSEAGLVEGFLHKVAAFAEREGNPG